ncbi:MAG: LysR family transcriptional regulator [Bacteroidia bacterium]|nr:LysR family transcriptional regulator [Bacteroidia bacterium]NND25534.1 LysR family transcriptional regulator [Flavobacteriaceae bacterium]MBT8279157.1 LysR family transcriptional regulator [Bacteroidia bacterium]NNK60845.1 LysR family transcriptional regulator [Flavobacteriaceae bacterium]NNL33864.1 LysR family transcriptional regulator [Flavobacteriaceae bacterium]
MDYKIKSRIWIEADGNILLGEGRVSLLKAIAETGSLSKAAKKLGMSYKKAWALIDAINTRAAKPAIVTNIGGKGGGGATLTPYGATLIEVFEKINKNCWRFLDKQIKKSELE